LTRNGWECKCSDSS
ncbi:matrix protein 2, partial [Influenza A virus (A/northern pintail/Alaska/44203-078/2006(H6N8))]